MSIHNGIPADRPWGAEGEELDVGFPDVLAILGKRKWTIVIVTVLVAALSFAFAAKQKTTYTSEGTVLVATTAQATSSGAQALATEKQLARSDYVAGLVAKDQHLQLTNKQIVAKLSVTVPLDTQILDFKYTDDNATTAQHVAQSFIKNYLVYRAHLLKGMLASSAAVSDQAQALRADLADAQAQAARSPIGSAAAATANARVNTLSDQITQLDQRLTTLLSSDNLVTSTSASNAAPALKNPPATSKSVAVGIIAGLVLGAFAALALEFVARKRRAREARIVELRREVNAFAERLAEDVGDITRVRVPGGHRTDRPQSSG
jgi:succinoglycan biosynthesis transport protein ExoP